MGQPLRYSQAATVLGLEFVLTLLSRFSEELMSSSIGAGTERITTEILTISSRLP
jgi:hypothetical protein